MWNSCLDLEDVLPCFLGLCSDIVTTPVNCKLGRLDVQVNPKDWEGYMEEEKEEEKKRCSHDEADNEEEVEPQMPRGHWDDRLTMFQKMCMIKCFREEKVISL